MSTKRRNGKLLSKAPSAEHAKMSATPVVDSGFATTWNGLDKAERRQIRRLVRIGRPQESAEQAVLAVEFAAYQRTRPWYRLFYLWIVPIAVAGLIAGSNIHPLVLGLVLGALVVSYMSRRNFKRVGKVNASLLAGEVPAMPAAA